VLPLVVLMLTVLFGFVALAIDLGLMAVARNQCQNAADSGATAGVRSFTGDSTTGYGYTSVPGNAIRAATANKVLTQQIQGDPNIAVSTGTTVYTTGQVKVELGAYAYYYSDDAGTPAGGEGFYLQLPRQRSTDPWSAVTVTISATNPTGFGGVFGMTSFNSGAVSTAVHRPRDVVIIMDLSGSMRFQSLPGVPMSGSQAAASSSNTPRTQSMNPESVFPQFGHYSDVTGAALQGTSSIPTTTGEYVDPDNISSTQNSGPPICADFFANPVGTAPGTGNVAFTRAPDGQATTPGGDTYLNTNGNSGGAYAKTVATLLAPGYSGSGPDGSFDNPTATTTTGWGYDKYVSFNGYTEGPGYWGKTFFIWPPDPRGATSACPALNATSTVWRDNGAKDWRQKFFVEVNTSASNTPSWLDDDSVLWDTSTGAVKAPGTTTTINNANYTYRINYLAILYWLQNTGTAGRVNPFPATLQAGRIRFYTNFPDTTDGSLNNRWWTTTPSSLPNDERFWKEYVDFVLGVLGTGAGTYTTKNQNNGSNPNVSTLIGNGDWFNPTGNTFAVSAHPVPPSTAASYRTANPNATYALGTAANTALSIKNLSAYSGAITPGTQYVTIGSNSHVYTVATLNTSANTLSLTEALVAGISASDTIKFLVSPYVSYTDSPKRPRHQFWFGPMTFVDWLGNYNTNKFWWPGNVHEAHAWACKVGIQTAIDDIENNHPNDLLAMTFFSSPTTTTQSGHHNQAVVALGRNYQQIKDSLWFPPTTVTGGVSEIGPYDTDMDYVPRANGGTAPGMGFMIAYNQLSSSYTNLRDYPTPQATYRGLEGGLGRKGSARLIIFETDGCPNSRAFATVVNSGSDSYYPIRVKKPANLSDPANVEWPTGTAGYVQSEVTDVVAQICALDTATSGAPGYSKTRKPVLVHCLGYGGDFDPANAGTNQTNALNFLQAVQGIGRTQEGPDPTDATYPLASYKRIYGPNDQRITNMQKAFTKIMQDGVQVSLIQ
jgi:hypothetical protein